MVLPILKQTMADRWPFWIRLIFQDATFHEVLFYSRPNGQAILSDFHDIWQKLLIENTYCYKLAEALG